MKKIINSLELELKANVAMAAACILLLVGIGTVVRGQSVVPLPSASQNAPDLQIIVVGGMPNGDVVNITYPSVTVAATLHADLAALGEELGVNVTNAHISTSGLPEMGGETPAMTSVTLSAPGAAPLNTGSLPLDKLILALKNYRRLAITYIMPPGYQYTGLQQFSNSNLDIEMTETGSTYSFVVNVRNPNFTSLSLPATSQVPADSVPAASTSTEGRLLVFRILGLIAVSIIAALTGWGVYASLAKLR